MKPSAGWACMVMASLLGGCGHGGTSSGAAGSARMGAATSPAADSDGAETQASAPGSGAATAPDEDRLSGTWVANDVDAKMGQVKVQVTFKKQGSLHLIAWSDIPLVGQVRNKSGPYEVKGDVISSQAIRGGTSVKYWFDGGDLVIQYAAGKQVRFHRKG
ncbi:MAG TPA: hypothetical protein VH253_00150 [Phycisphaerae bacterium]|nr:hypothetical protein [Phycisphaerae bacterium]